MTMLQQFYELCQQREVAMAAFGQKRPFKFARCNQNASVATEWISCRKSNLNRSMHMRLILCCGWFNLLICRNDVCLTNMVRHIRACLAVRICLTLFGFPYNWFAQEFPLRKTGRSALGLTINFA